MKDTNLFIKPEGSNVIILLLYIDDIVLISNNSALHHFLVNFNAKSPLKDLGKLSTSSLVLRYNTIPLVCFLMSINTFLV